MHCGLVALTLSAVLLDAAGAIAAERSATLAVDNMYCKLCPTVVKQSLTKIGGVKNVAVSFEKKTATVIYDDSRTSLDTLIEATTQAGYPSHAIQ